MKGKRRFSFLAPVGRRTFMPDIEFVKASVRHKAISITYDGLSTLVQVLMSYSACSTLVLMIIAGMWKEISCLISRDHGASARSTHEEKAFFL